MNNQMLRLWIVITIVCLLRSVDAVEPPISVAELAKITGYPTEKLTVVDSTVESNNRVTRKKFPQCVSNHYYHGDFFVPISIIIGKKGTALSPELEEKFSKTVATPNYPGQLRRLILSPDVRGYSGIGMVGAGGAIYRSVVSIERLDRDIQITISFGEEGEKGENLPPGAEAYLKAVMADGGEAILQKCIVAATNHVIAELTPEGVGVKPLELTEIPQSRSAPQVFQTSPVEPPESEAPAQSFWWILWSILALAVVAIVASAAKAQRTRGAK